MAGVPEGDLERKGCVLIISNPYDGPLNYKKDAERMKNLWVDKVRCENFKDGPHLNINAEETLELFKSLSNNDSFDYLVVVVIANGRLLESYPTKLHCMEGGTLKKTYNAVFFAENDDVIYEDDMMSYFMRDNCTWLEKPKLFILQYNRFNSYTKENKIYNIRRTELSHLPLKSGRGPTHRCFDIRESIIVSSRSSDLVKMVVDAFGDRWSTHSVVQMLGILNSMCNEREVMTIFESTMIVPFYLNQLSRGKRMKEEFIRNAIKQNGDTNQNIISQVVNYLKSLPPHLLRKGMDILDGDEKTNGKKTEEIYLSGNGYALIICNRLSPESTSHEYDEEVMRKLLKDELGWELHEGRTYLNQNAEKMTKLFQDVSKQSSDAEYLFVYVSSHGCVREKLRKEGSEEMYVPMLVLKGSEGEVCERDLMSYFKSQNNWTGKIKIFVWNCCRGPYHDENMTGPSPYHDVEEDILPPTITTMLDDCIVVYATSPDHLAFSKRLASALDEAVAQKWKSTPLMDMLTSVNACMRKYSDNCPNRTTSMFKSTATIQSSK